MIDTHHLGADREIVVKTSSGATYVIDQSGSVVTRIQPEDGSLSEAVHDLPLVEVLDCKVGAPLRFVVETPWGNTPNITWRSSPVVSIVGGDGEFDTTAIVASVQINEPALSDPVPSDSDMRHDDKGEPCGSDH